MTMDWEVKGTFVDIGAFRDFTPDRVLYDFDGPRIFTLKNDLGEFLAYLCDEWERVSRYLLVPTSPAIIKSLESGCKTVREALNQPWLWVVDVAFDGKPEQAWKSDLASIPDDVLPKPSVMLWPCLQPLLSVRMVGDHLSEGDIPASVVRRAVEGASNALKQLAEKVLATTQNQGRPSSSLSQFFDLPVQRMAFGSFEISFREPDQKQLPLAGQRIGIPREFEEIGQKLARALEWAADANPDEENLEIDLDLLKALDRLVPPQSGYVQKVELSGRIFKPEHKPTYVLTRRASKTVRQTLVRIRDPQEQVITIKGTIREFDKDQLTFILRETEDSKERTCSISDDLYDEVMELFQTDLKVSVTGRESRTKTTIDVSLISRLSTEPAFQEIDS